MKQSEFAQTYAITVASLLLIPVSAQETPKPTRVPRKPFILSEMTASAPTNPADVRGNYALDILTTEILHRQAIIKKGGVDSPDSRQKIKIAVSTTRMDFSFAPEGKASCQCNFPDDTSVEGSGEWRKEAEFVAVTLQTQHGEQHFIFLPTRAGLIWIDGNDVPWAIVHESVGLRHLASPALEPTDFVGDWVLDSKASFKPQVRELTGKGLPDSPATRNLVTKQLEKTSLSYKFYADGQASVTHNMGGSDGPKTETGRFSVKGTDGLELLLKDGSGREGTRLLKLEPTGQLRYVTPQQFTWLLRAKDQYAQLHILGLLERMKATQTSKAK